VLLFSSCITSTLVPLYIKQEQSLGRESANRFASNTLNIFMLAAVIVSALMFAFAPQLVTVVYPGFDGDSFSLTVTLSRIMYPTLIFFVAGLVLSSLLNAQEHYLAAQLTGFPLSFSLILAAILFSDSFGIHAQAWGVVIAGALQVVILWPTLRKSYRYSPVLNVKDSSFLSLLVLAAPSVLSMAVNELNHMVDRMLASGLNAGDISAMSYAFKLIMFMLGVLVVPLTTISFSKMSKEAAKRDETAVIPHVQRSFLLLFAVIVPIVCMAAVCSEDVIRLAYGRGAFGNDSVVITGAVFMFYVVGVPFFGIRDLLNRVFHSLQDTKTPMIIACVSMAVNICLNLVLRKLMGVNGLAFATAVAALVGVILLMYRLSRRIKNVFDKPFCIEIIKHALASGVSLAAALVIKSVLPTQNGILFELLRVVAICGTALIAYSAACALLRVKLAQRVLSLLKRS